MMPYLHRIKRFLTGSVLFGSIANLGMVRPLRADVFFGATASGNAKQFEITCGTCPNPVTTFSNQSDGGFGNNLAAVEFSNGEFVSFDAISAFRGANSLPRLGVLVSADVNVVAPSTFFYAASSTARATQEYLYTGSSPMDYTLEYRVNGQIGGGILTELAGGFTVFGAGFNPNQEVNPVLGFSFDHVNGDGTQTERQVHYSGDVTFTANPGDIFFVQTTLDAFADSRSEQLEAFADAFHTLDMSFTQGDPSLLIPSVTTSVFGCARARDYFSDWDWSGGVSNSGAPPSVSDLKIARYSIIRKSTLRRSALQPV
jgi:hypothetical protein